MTTLVTGTAGFIGAALAKRLLDIGRDVVGVDNHNDYYDVGLKEARVARLIDNPNYRHLRLDISDSYALGKAFKAYKPLTVVNLAAQAGVRYSMENPHAYIESNVIGFTNILEECRKYAVDHLVYASSSSVYGANTRMPFSVKDSVNHPLSLYAATKRANELMAHTYSTLYHLPTTGLRFFTVYGPWGRPDMALFKFTRAIMNDQPIELYNHGRHNRDFTYIDDIVEGIVRVLDRPALANPDWSSDVPDPSSSAAPWRVYNIGSSSSVPLLKYVEAIEYALGRTATVKLLPMQPGDVAHTFASVDELRDEFDYQPDTAITEGVGKFVTWYRDYFKV